MMNKAHNIPGPPELLPGLPDAMIDLQTEEGAALVNGAWRYSDTTIEEINFVSVGDDLGPSGAPNRTYTCQPKAHAADYDDSDWRVLAPEELETRLSTGQVCFNWYRISVTIPQAVGDFDPTGATVVFEIAVDDYAEVWVNGELPLVLGQTGGQVVGGFNTPNRIILTNNAQPGSTFQIAVFGINGPISASPKNYIWVRTASLDFYAADRVQAAWDAELTVEQMDTKLEVIVPPDARLEQVATGFAFTEGPLWDAKGNFLLFSSPNTNTIYRWLPTGKVEIFRAKSGYTGMDIGRYHQPGSNGLTFSPNGLLTICQHGNRRVLRVNPRGDTTVMADNYNGQRLNSPNDLVYRSDGVLYFTDPPFGLPGVFDDPAKETPFSGVYYVTGPGEIGLVTDELSGPNGLAFSPDEKYLYVGDWDMNHKAVMRYPVNDDGSTGPGETFYDMTDADGKDAIDGIKVDVEGNVYVCGPGGLWILSADGVPLGRLKLPEAPHNIAWGEADGKTLYICAQTSIYRIRLNIKGIRPE
ncbi:MAG: hypothetical protein OHK0046_17540 [Anaerolineae bacterium]